MYPVVVLDTNDRLETFQTQSLSCGRTFSGYALETAGHDFHADKCVSVRI